VHEVFFFLGGGRSVVNIQVDIKIQFQYDRTANELL